VAITYLDIETTRFEGTAMAKMIFVNLPVKDLPAATRFYEAIGFEKNPQFSNEQASSMVWSDTISFMLLTHDYYGTFITRPIADAHKTSAGLFYGFMYGRTFEDLDGNRADVDGRFGDADGGGLRPPASSG
jgi:predicted lactoylglutathione lyase